MNVSAHRITGLGQISEVLLKGVFSFCLIISIPACSVVDILLFRLLPFQRLLLKIAFVTYSILYIG